MQRNLVVMTSDEMGLPLLEALSSRPANVKLTGVFTRPDRKRGRGQHVQPNAIKQWALKHHLPVLQPEKKPAQAEIDWLRRHDVSLVLVFAYGHLLTQAFLDTPDLGVLNVHTSLLPAYRGPSPIETAVSQGDSQTGLSLMQLVQAMDAGPVSEQCILPISPTDTAGTLREAMAKAAVPLFCNALEAVFTQKADFKEQDASKATYTRMLSKADGTLDFSAPAKTLAARIRGLFPWPGCSAALPSGERLKFGMAQALDTPTDASPGTLIQADNSGLYLSTGQGTLRIDTLQRPAARMLPADAFLRGFAFESGTRFLSEPMPELLRS